MKRRLFLPLLLLGLLAQAGGAMAQQGYWRDLPPEERQQMRQQMREQWRQERDLRREEGGRHWREVPPEERRQMRDQMREQHGWPEERGGRGRHGGGRD